MVNLYRVLSCKWYANNGDGFLENKDCYKIHCFDENDDIVDVFSSHHHEVGARHSLIQYNTDDWQRFFESLKFIFELESELYFLFKK